MSSSSARISRSRPVATSDAKRMRRSGSTQSEMAVRVAILDDYQDAASQFGDWTRLSSGSTVVPFKQHIDDDDELADSLAGFDVVVAMRERTPFARARLERLPDLH